MVELNAKNPPPLMRLRDYKEFLEPVEQPGCSSAFEPEDPYEEINSRKPPSGKCTNNYSCEYLNSENSVYREVRNSFSDKSDYVYLKIQN